MSARMYEDLRDMLKQELNAIVKKGELTKEILDNLHKLIASLEKTERLVKEEQGGSSYGYSQGYSQRYYRDGSSHDYSGNSYNGSYDNSYDYAHGRRGRDGDGDGRYSEDYSGRRYSRDGYSRDGYSGHDEKQHMVEKLKKMASEVSDQQTKMMIHDCIRGIEG